jgi:hypothetical protein
MLLLPPYPLCLCLSLSLSFARSSGVGYGVGLAGRSGCSRAGRGKEAGGGGDRMDKADRIKRMQGPG